MSNRYNDSSARVKRQPSAFEPNRRRRGRSVKHAGHAEEHPIAAAIKAALDCDHVEVTAEGSGCGQKVQAVVVSSAFAGVPLLKQHKLVMKGAEAEIAKVHAFSLKTYTPAKWAAKK